MSNSEALVVGGGVCGLTSALRLRQANFDVSILAESLDPKVITSGKATAIWHLFKIEHPLAPLWGGDTVRYLTELSNVGGSGVELVSGREYLEIDRTDDPIWSGLVLGFRWLRSDEIPVGPQFAHIRSGYEVRVPAAHMPTYLRHLRDRVERAGVEIRTGRVESLDDVIGEQQIVVNCTGLAAREVTPDPGVYPIQGQYAVFATGDAYREYYGDDFNPAGMNYAIPRFEQTLVGGTEDAGREDLVYDMEVERNYIELASRYLPGLDKYEIVDRVVAGRPCRKPLRIGSEQRNGGAVVHSYGHGGSGWSISWGCGEAVALLALAARDGRFYDDLDEDAFDELRSCYPI